MDIRKKITDHELFTLLALASKVCSEKTVIESKNTISQKQLDLLKATTCKVLSRLDREFPAIIPIPTDGKPWSTR